MSAIEKHSLIGNIQQQIIIVINLVSRMTPNYDWYRKKTNYGADPHQQGMFELKIIRQLLLL